MAVNAAAQRSRAALSTAARVHNAMTHMRRARAGVSRSAATACQAAATRLAEELSRCGMHLGHQAGVVLSCAPPNL
jgi:hypothetical protein